MSLSPSTRWRGRGGGGLDNENSDLNVEFQETQFKSLGIQLITLFLFLVFQSFENCSISICTLELCLGRKSQRVAVD